MMRGLKSARILPKLLLFRAEPETPPTRPTAAGFRKLTRFSRLNDSARISMDCLSVTLNRRERAKSTSKYPGPPRLLRPRFPNVPGTTGSVLKAAEVNQQV